MERRLDAADLCRLSVQLENDVGLRLSVDAERISRVLAHARRSVPDTATPRVDERTDFFAAEQLTLRIELGASGSLAIWAQEVVAAAARSCSSL